MKVKSNMNEFSLKESRQYISKALPYKRKSIYTKDIDIEMLEDARKIMAKVVEKYGNQYLPAFIRIHNEIERRKKELSYRSIALQIAANDP